MKQVGEVFAMDGKSFVVTDVGKISDGKEFFSFAPVEMKLATEGFDFWKPVTVHADGQYRPSKEKREDRLTSSDSPSTNDSSSILSMPWLAAIIS